jgi:hypothetical protein
MPTQIPWRQVPGIFPLGKEQSQTGERVGWRNQQPGMPDWSLGAAPGLEPTAQTQAAPLEISPPHFVTFARLRLHSVNRQTTATGYLRPCT